MNNIGTRNVLDVIRDVLHQESEAIKFAARRINVSIEETIELIINIRGRVIFTGLGKTGCVARKAAATFCSTGTPAFFLHAGEASHGDLGLVTTDDVVIAYSYSGESTELLNLMPYMQRFEIPVISITGNPASQLAALSDHVIDISIPSEADDLLAPTCSTTVAMAISDAMAIAIAKSRGFTNEQFAIFHPGGNLGRKMLVTVQNLMHKNGDIPMAAPDRLLRESVLIMSEKRLGSLIVTNKQKHLIGILTDGDIRRVLQKQSNPLDDAISNFMTGQPQFVHPEALAAEALQLMQQKEISVLPVVDKENIVVGVVHIHDLLKAGIA